jgi:hypothetical protein
MIKNFGLTILTVQSKGQDLVRNSDVVNLKFITNKKEYVKKDINRKKYLH